MLSQNILPQFRLQTSWSPLQLSIRRRRRKKKPPRPRRKRKPQSKCHPKNAALLGIVPKVSARTADTNPNFCAVCTSASWTKMASWNTAGFLRNPKPKPTPLEQPGPVPRLQPVQVPRHLWGHMAPMGCMACGRMWPSGCTAINR